jgi:hemin uptake protein HemP
MNDPPSAPRRRRKPAQPPPTRSSKPPPRLKVSDLLGKGREAILEYEGQEYRLLITANRKLLLMK